MFTEDAIRDIEIALTKDTPLLVPNGMTDRDVEWIAKNRDFLVGYFVDILRCGGLPTAPLAV
jgi:hypothetical protein